MSDLLHILVVVLLLQLFDKHGLLVGTFRVLLFGIALELFKGLLV